MWLKALVILIVVLLAPAATFSLCVMVFAFLNGAVGVAVIWAVIGMLLLGACWWLCRTIYPERFRSPGVKKQLAGFALFGMWPLALPLVLLIEFCAWLWNLIPNEPLHAGWQRTIAGLVLALTALLALPFSLLLLVLLVAQPEVLAAAFMLLVSAVFFAICRRLWRAVGLSDGPRPTQPQTWRPNF